MPKRSTEKKERRNSTPISTKRESSKGITATETEDNQSLKVLRNQAGGVKPPRFRQRMADDGDVYS